jgi:hypothetical protein
MFPAGSVRMKMIVVVALVNKITERLAGTMGIFSINRQLTLICHKLLQYLTGKQCGEDEKVLHNGCFRYSDPATVVSIPHCRHQIKRGSNIGDYNVLAFDNGNLKIFVCNIFYLHNSLRYGRSGGYVRIVSEISDDQCQITVSDDGPGIEPENLPHVFERFYRADTVRDRSGSGLGLSIARWIVQMHGGFISVSSVPSQETVFAMLIPMGGGGSN